MVMPSTALDLCGLLRTAIRCDDPVLFLEHKHLYRQPYNRSAISRTGLHDSVRARARGEGRHGREHHHVRSRGSSRRGGGGATGARRYFRGNYRSSLALAIRLGCDCRDRSQNESRDCGARRHALVGLRRGNCRAHRRQLFDELDAPVRRVAAMDTFCAYQPNLEDEILPQSGDLAAAVRELLAY